VSKHIPISKKLIPFTPFNHPMNLVETELAPPCRIETAVEYAKKRKRLHRNCERCYFIHIYLDRNERTIRELKRFLGERDCDVDLAHKPVLSIRCDQDEIDELYSDYLQCTEEPYCVHCKVIWKVACPRLRKECPKLFTSPQDLAYDVDAGSVAQLEEFL